jgi:hypothetical protein
MTEYHIRLLLYAKLAQISPELILQLYNASYSRWIKEERIVWCDQTGQIQNGRWTVDQNNLFDEWLCYRWNFSRPIEMIRKSIKRIPIK